MPEEVRFFRRLALYALVIGVVYWFASYDWAGTTLLVLFGLGASASTLVLRASARVRPAVVAERPASEADGPFGDESGRIPAPTTAPFLVGSGVALAGLGLVFGPWFTLVGLIPLAMGAAAWFGSARAELDATEGEE